jgi:hypothetical protein
MNREEMLRVIAMEECNEIAQRISKAIRFGLQQIQPGQEKTNERRVKDEFNDLVAMLRMLDLFELDEARQAEKRNKVEKYLKFSIVCGTMDDESALVQGALDAQAGAEQRMFTMRTELSNAVRELDEAHAAASLVLQNCAGAYKLAKRIDIMGDQMTELRAENEILRKGLGR